MNFLRSSVIVTCRRNLSTVAVARPSSRPNLQDGLELNDFINVEKPSRSKVLPKPPWLKAQAPTSEAYKKMKESLRGLNLVTVCEEARCPNIGECWGGKDGVSTSTIMLMGDTCTRGCRFCNVKTSRTPPPLDPEEPARVSQAILKWGLEYVVLTSVDRDDLEDGGANHFAHTVRLLKNHTPAPLVECLTPDFQGNKNQIDIVSASGLDVYAHNIETVERLQRTVRDYRAGYRQSIGVLEHVRATHPEMITKTSIMLGCGERPEEIRQTLQDLKNSGIQVVTFGQYLRPSKKHMKVQEYVTPEAFKEWQDVAESMGFLYVASGPLVRSSYRAGEFFIKNVLKKRKEANATISEPK